MSSSHRSTRSEGVRTSPPAMELINARELARRTSWILEEVETAGRPFLVTKHGRPIATILPIDNEELEDFLLTHAREYVESMEEAEVELRFGKARPASQVLAELNESNG